MQCDNLVVVKVNGRLYRVFRPAGQEPEEGEEVVFTISSKSLKEGDDWMTILDDIGREKANQLNLCVVGLNTL